MAPTVKTNSRMLVMLHSGKAWVAAVYKDKGWKAKHLDEVSVDVLPDELLAWGDSMGASSVRVALQEELEEFDILNDTPAMVPPAMLHQMLNETASIRHDTDTDSVSPAMASKNLLSMGDSAQNLIGAVFERALVQGYTDTCARRGMKFMGVTSFISMLLAYYKSLDLPMTHSLMYHGQKKSYVIGYSGNDTTVSYRDLPINNMTDDPELAQRSERRLRSYLHQHITVITHEALIGQMTEYIHGMDPQLGLEMQTISTARASFYALMANTSPYMLEEAIGFAILPPPLKDDKFLGSILMVGMVVLVSATLGLMVWGKTREKNLLTKLRADISALQSAQKSASDNLANKNATLDSLRDLHDNLQVASGKFSRHYYVILNALAKTTPRYSLISSVTQEANGVTLIKGQTIWAEEVSSFAKNLQEALYNERLPYRVTLLGSSRNTLDPNKSDFTMEVK